jgi:ATP-dependent exoDNAse (exonuclease V) alpha subunit
MTSWSPQQDDALRAVARWLKATQKRAPQVFRLFGYAGVGKTTLAKEIASGVDGKVLFGAFTGKAAHVLHQKGCSGASTIHSLIYKLEDGERDEPRFVLNRDSPVSGASLVIIDEVSMVDEALGRDLLSFGTPILVLGDPAQLPPVKGTGFFTEARPDVMLTEVHRQAAESPIIRMATEVRQGGRLVVGEYGDARVIARAALSPDEVLAADQVLVGLNKTRHSYNDRIRTLKGIKSETPIVGDKLVCLRNSKEKRLLNGSLWRVAGTPAPKKDDRRDGTTRLVVTPDDAGARERNVDVRVKSGFWSGRDGDLDWRDKRGTEEFTYGYALTTHKAQGSQWDSVMVFDESATFRDDRARWLYTAITRAAKKLTVVVNGAAA